MVVEMEKRGGKVGEVLCLLRGQNDGDQPPSNHRIF